MRITFRIKDSFFDRPAVVAALGRARTKALSRAGAFVQRRARSSMRRRKKSSAPGQPPSAHSTSNRTLKTILFAFDGRVDRMIVGPEELNQVEDTIMARTTVPALHEFGETALILEKRWVPNVGQPSRWRRMDRRRSVRLYDNGREETRRRAAQYPKRPFMAPALKAEAPKFPDLFGNSIKAT
jgi:hypothetical protein